MLSSTGLFLGAWPCNAHAIKRLGSCSPRLLHRTNHGGDFGGTPVHPLKMKKSGSHVQMPESFQQTNKQHFIISFVKHFALMSRIFPPTVMFSNRFWELAQDHPNFNFMKGFDRYPSFDRLVKTQNKYLPFAQ